VIAAWIVAAVFGCILVACSDSTGGMSNARGGDAASSSDDDAGADGRVCAACDGACEEAVTVASAIHVTGTVAYDDPPPAGGPHDGCWGDYAVYDNPPLPVERWVHNLEHGAVVFVYHCPDGCDAEVAALTALAAGLDRTIVTPYFDMPEGFAAVSWGHRLVSSCLDIDAMQAFYDAHFDQALESVSSGAPSGC
jgi:hypothetical protein